MISVPIIVNVTPQLKYCWRRVRQGIANRRHKKALKLYVQALKVGQEGVMRSLAELSLIEDWPLAIEARISLDREGGHPHVSKHPSGMGLLIELTRWDSKNPKERGDAAFLVARKVEYKQWVKDNVRENPVARDALAWTILDALQKRNEVLARVIAPKFPIEFRKDVEPPIRSMADHLVQLINESVRGPGSSVEGLSPQFAMAFRHRFQFILSLIPSN